MFHIIVIFCPLDTFYNICASTKGRMSS